MLKPSNHPVAVDTWSRLLASWAAACCAAVQVLGDSFCGAADVSYKCYL